MALSRVKVWGAERLYASDLNAEFNNIISNAASLISPLSAGLDWDGFAHTLDAAGVTTAQSTAAVAWSFTPGSKTGTPGTTGSISNWAANTVTDNNTAGSGIAATWTGHAFHRPTLAATNALVTTTNAATIYIENAPLAGSNETITNPYALWVDDGASRFDGAVSSTGAISTTSTLSGTPTGSLVPAGYLFGFGMSNGTDTTNDINIAVGECASDDATAANRVLMTLTSGYTKQLDAAWAVGTNQGGRDTGAISNATWHMYVIQRPDTGVVDLLFSLSATSPTMPNASYTKKRRIGSVVRSGGTIIQFIQDGDVFQWMVPLNDINAGNPGTSAVTALLTVPTGINVMWVGSASIFNNNNSETTALVTDLATTDTAPSTTLYHVSFGNQAGDLRGSTYMKVRTNTSAQVRYRLSASNANTSFLLNTIGWTDSRGQLY